MKRGLLRTLPITVALTIALGSWSAMAADYGKKDKSDINTTSTTLSKKETSFVSDAVLGGLAEVRMGELAKQKGQSADVKQFGERLAADHMKANDELKALASKKGITVPTQMSDKHQRTIDKLTSASDFDKEFKDMAIKDHKKDIKEFEKAEKKCEDPELKAWISKALPTLQEHLRMAEQLGPTRTARQ